MFELFRVWCMWMHPINNGQLGYCVDTFIHIWMCSFTGGGFFYVDEFVRAFVSARAWPELSRALVSAETKSG